MEMSNSLKNDKKIIKIVDKRFWAQKNINPEEIGKEAQEFEERKLFPSYVQELEEKLKKAEQQLTEYIAAYKELKNQQNAFMKRMEKLKETEVDEFKIKLFTKIIEVMDDLNRAIQAYKQYEDGNGLYQGIELIYQQMLKLLSTEGVETIEIKDDNFDPRYIEPIAIEPIENKDMDNKIAEVILSGYTFKDRIIRPAKVKLFKFKNEEV